MEKFFIWFLVLLVVCEAIAVTDYVMWLIRERKKGNCVSSHFRQHIVSAILSAPLSALFIVSIGILNLLDKWYEKRLRKNEDKDLRV